jgi:transcriptional regulator with XRE-family HTH domain
MAGIKEVAQEAGVSTATVSRALRGLHHVNQQTREKIIAAAEKLNYPLTTERQEFWKWPNKLCWSRCLLYFSLVFLAGN